MAQAKKPTKQTSSTLFSSTSKSTISLITKSLINSTTKSETKSTTLFFTTTEYSTTPVTVLPSKLTTMKSTTCSCQVKKVSRHEICHVGSNKWKDKATRAKYSRVATLSDAIATKDTWCKTTGKWEVGGADGAKYYGQGYKCHVEKHGSSSLLKSDQGCPGKWATFLMCLACPGPGG